MAFALLLALLLPAGSLFAQKLENLDLQLNHGLNRQRKSATVPSRSEFKLSLGSQLFDEDDTISGDYQLAPELSRIETAEIYSDFASIEVDRSPIRVETSPQLRLRTSRPAEQQRFAPTITLSSSYEDNSIGFTDPSAESLSISGNTGKLRIYGEFEQQRVMTAMPQRGDAFSTPAVDRAIRASIVANENNGQRSLETHEKSDALASRYYLEAVYSFKPTLKGKISFRRSMIDTYESEEKLQLEGIVEANQNVLIKAGYKNEVRPEATDTKSSNDTKVWTEFILKF